MVTHLETVELNSTTYEFEEQNNKAECFDFVKSNEGDLKERGAYYRVHKKFVTNNIPLFEQDGDGNLFYDLIIPRDADVIMNIESSCKFQKLANKEPVEDEFYVFCAAVFMQLDIRFLFGKTVPETFTLSYDAAYLPLDERAELSGAKIVTPGHQYYGGVVGNLK